MIKNILLSLLISSQAFAGLPPTTTRGQSDSTAKTTFNFQAPHNQFTDLGGVKTLIETGNGNILKNPGFEGGSTDWTEPAGTIVANSTAKGTGVLGGEWNPSSTSTLTSAQVTIPNGYMGRNGVAGCTIKAASGTVTQSIYVFDGTNNVSTPLLISANTNSFSLVNFNFIFPSSGTIALRFSAIGGDPNLYIDDCYIKLADNVYDAPLVTSWVPWTPTGSWTTNTTYTGLKRRVGDTMEYQVKIAATGAPSSGNLSVNLPAGEVINGAKLTGYNFSGGTYFTNIRSSGSYFKIAADSSAGVYAAQEGTNVTSVRIMTGIVNATSATNAQLQYRSVTPTAPATWVNGDAIDISFSLPIVGLNAVSAVSADQTDYDWTNSNSFTFNNLGSITGSIYLRRIGSSLEYQGTITTGTTGSPQSIQLPSGLAIDYSKLGTSSSQVGVWAQSSSGATNIFSTSGTGGILFVDGSDTGKIFINAQSTGNVFSKNNSINSTALFTIKGSIPIQGWSSNQRAPTLVGSVTSNSASALKIEYVTFDGGTVGTNCTGTCTVRDASTSGITVTRAGAGAYDISFSASPFSSIPNCVGTGTRNGTGTSAVRYDLPASSATSARIVGENPLNTTSDMTATVFCFGKR